jgi:alpha-ketoglutarate-dependent taurine dioxygenase
LWFLCVKPAEKGGETFLVDGIELWSTLDDVLKRRFQEQKIRYVFPRADQNVWPTFTGCWSEQAEAVQRLAALADVRHRVNHDGTIDIEYLTYAARPTRWSDSHAFVNSIIVHDEGALFFEDGSPITRDLKWELLGAAQGITTMVKWNAGDMLLVDNTRMLHGRMPFADRGRTIHARMSQASF